MTPYRGGVRGHLGDERFRVVYELSIGTPL